MIAAVRLEKARSVRGLFNAKNTVPLEATQLRIPKIIPDAIPTSPKETAVRSTGAFR